MNFRKLFLIFAIIAMSLSSCNNDDELDPAIIFGSWQYSKIESFVIETNKDSLTAAIKYKEIALREDSTIMIFNDDYTLNLEDKNGITNSNTYKYSFDGRNKLSITMPDETVGIFQFDVIGNVAIYKTGPLYKTESSSKISYTNEDGGLNEEAFNMLVKEYPKTMEGLVFKDLKIYNIYFFELFKRQMLYY